MELFITTGGIFAKGKKQKHPMKNVLGPQSITLTHRRNRLTLWPRRSRYVVIALMSLCFEDAGNYQSKHRNWQFVWENFDEYFMSVCLFLPAFFLNILFIFAIGPKIWSDKTENQEWYFYKACSWIFYVSVCICQICIQTCVRYAFMTPQLLSWCPVCVLWGAANHV